MFCIISLINYRASEGSEGEEEIYLFAYRASEGSEGVDEANASST